MTTDIDRLHYVVQNKRKLRHERGVGKTYASCHELAGVLEVTQERGTIVVLSYMRDLCCLRDEIRKVFDEHEIYIGRSWEYELLCDVPENGQKIVRFISSSEKEERLRGTTWPVVSFERD